MEAQSQPKDYFSQWDEFQKGLFSQWTDSYAKMYQPWTDTVKFWQSMGVPFASLDLFSMWGKMTRDNLAKMTEQAGEGVGPTVAFRMLRASNVFVVLNEFWMEVLKDLSRLYEVREDAVKSREIFEQWVQRYNKVFEQLMGSPPSGTAQEIMTSWLNTMQAYQAATGLMWNPWLQAMPRWQEQTEKFMKGDWSALMEARSLWREVYDETLGRTFMMPAFGLTKEQLERLRRTYDAFVRYWFSIPTFYQFFYKTGTEALKEVFDKVQNMKLEEMKPETLREIYQIWWTTNENAFFQLFKNPDFCNAMGEVLNYGLRLKKRLDELTAEWCKAMSIPSNREFDEVAMAVQDLRRKVRMQQKTIEELERKLGPTIQKRRRQ